MVYAGRRRLISRTALPLALVMAAAACGGGGDATGSAAESSPVATTAAGCDDVDLSSPPDEPVTIRLGHGAGTEDPLYVQFLAPDVTGAEHYGTWYEVEATEFSPPDRLAAYQAGDLDAGTVSAPQLFNAVGSGLDIAAVASIAVISADAEYAFPYLALDDSGIDSIEDLEGATIGIIAPNTSTEYWAKAAVVEAGLDPDRDVTFASIPPPNAEQALRDGQTDVQFFAAPFFVQAQATGGVHEVFDALTGPGFDHELLDVFFDRTFIEQNPGAFCGWRADYVSAMAAYQADRPAFGEVMIAEGYEAAPTVEAYASRPDTGRPEGGAIHLENVDQLIQSMKDVGFLPGELDVAAADLVMEGYSLTR